MTATEHPIIFTGEQDSEGPWQKARFMARYTSEWKSVDGWASRCKIFGLSRHESKDAYVLSHLPTGRRMGIFMNHETASTYIVELSQVCDPALIVAADESEYSSTIAGVDSEYEVVWRWAKACLGAMTCERKRVLDGRTWDELPGSESE